MDGARGGPLRLLAVDAGCTLGALVAGALGDAALAEEVIVRGGAWIGRERVQDAAQPVPAGSQLTISRPPTGRYEELALDPAWIIYEDADLLALDKPAGVYVEMTPWSIGGNLRAALAEFLAQRDSVEPALHLVHRLDRDTSGVLLFSKNPELNAALQRSFAERAAHKEYMALCAGEPAESVFELATGHGRAAQGLFRVYPADEIGRQLPERGGVVKPMATRFAVERRLGDVALVRAFPLTGRTHQIRLHLAHIGHPLLGDARYGGPAHWRGAMLPGHLLHAELLRLPHPRGGAPLELRAPAPAWATGAGAPGG
ncbi:MAG TPA: RluA family pseudouridine synthase [Roseiflexaceae bacterium]|nr:RluA family pseudouridine synthase [Roseiflexaceae bacterium]